MYDLLLASLVPSVLSLGHLKSDNSKNIMDNNYVTSTFDLLNLLFFPVLTMFCCTAVGSELISTELQYSDHYALLAAHLLLDVNEQKGMQRKVTGESLTAMLCSLFNEDDTLKFQFQFIYLAK